MALRKPCSSWAWQASYSALVMVVAARTEGACAMTKAAAVRQATVERKERSWLIGALDRARLPSTPGNEIGPTDLLTFRRKHRKRGEKRQIGARAPQLFQVPTLEGTGEP